MRVETPWEMVRRLLAVWDTRQAAVLPAYMRGDDDAATLWHQRQSQVQEALRAEVTSRPSTPLWKLSVAANTLIGEVLARATDKADAAHAVAWALDDVLWWTFERAWSAEGGGADHWLREGDLFPVGDFPIQMLPPESEFGSMPASLQVSPDELPHVRRLPPGGPRVLVRHGFAPQLAAVLDRMRFIATGHPNCSLEEFRSPPSGDLFPVRVRDLKRQQRLVLRCLERMAQENATVMVLPELAVPEDLLPVVEEWVNGREDPVLLIAGSAHRVIDGLRRNRAVGFLPDAPQKLEHDKMRPFQQRERDGRSRVEGIVPGDHLTVFTAHPFRLSLAICKDFIGSDIVNRLGHLGVNLLLVPAMTKKTEAFEAAMGALSLEAQALTVVANNPVSWEPETPALATYGQPLRPAPVIAVPSKPARSTTLAPSVSVLGPGRGKVKVHSDV